MQLAVLMDALETLQAGTPGDRARCRLCQALVLSFRRKVLSECLTPAAQKSNQSIAGLGRRIA